MTTLRVSIRDELMAVVEAQAAEGRYGSVDAYIQALVERDERRLRARRALDAKIQEGLDSGPSEPMTREEWDSIEAEAMELRRRRENAGR